jgi:Acetyltransferase (GNAT) domain
LLFHEPWWLSAASAGNWRETTVSSDGRVVARLPFVIVPGRLGLTRIEMPPFTHVLGPIVNSGDGKPQTQIARRLSLVRRLLDQLPRFDHFAMVLDSGSPDGLAFQSRGFKLSSEYIFCIDCRRDVDDIWKAMNYRLRQNIRRAEEKFTVAALTDPRAFIDFYEETLRSKGLRNTIDFSNFCPLFEQTSRRDSGEILCAYWQDGRPAAMIFTVWDNRRAYYLLSMRAGDEGDNGSVCLLVWSALARAHARGLVFDFLGASTSGRAKFYVGFGGIPETRLVAHRVSRRYELLAWAGQIRHIFRPVQFK